MPEIFSARRAKREHAQEAFQAQLYQQSGHLKRGVGLAEKELVLAPEAKRALIEPTHRQISVARSYCQELTQGHSIFDGGVDRRCQRNQKAF